MKISELKINPNNPQKFEDLSKLENSIKEFPKMMELRPLIVDNNNMVLGGNKRLLCLQNLGYKEIPDNWVKSAQDLTMDEQRRFIIADNVGFGVWDWDALSEWDEPLEDWGLEVPEKKLAKTEGDVEFSEFIGEENNYIVLLFDNEMDWLSAQTHFNIKTVKSKRANGKDWSKGVGRVINGADYLNKLKNEIL